jgi:putative ABC transport system permease protein
MRRICFSAQVWPLQYLTLEAMIKSYLKIAFRNLRRESIYSSINIAGLGIGLGATLVIFTFVLSELSYDKKFDASERIYRVGVGFSNLGIFASGPEVLAPTIHYEMPFVEGVTRLRRAGNRDIRVVNVDYTNELIYEVDANYFEVFSFPIIEGTAEAALQDNSSIVISKQLADLYFNNQPAIGKSIEIGESGATYTVTAVVDNSAKSHMKANIWRLYKSADNVNWAQAEIYTYVRLNEGTKVSELTQALKTIIEHKVFPEISGDASFEEWLKTDAAFKFDVQRLSDIYFKSQRMFELSAGGNMQFIYIFSSIAVFILVLASINFINLTTARSVRRGKEVGVRKSLGGSKHQLVSQFLFESLIMSSFALIVGLAVFEGFVMVFEQIMNIRVVSVFGLGGQFLLAFGLSATIGLLAGIYPALNLTRFSTTKVLKSNSIGIQNGKSYARNTLVIFQFTISITLIIATLLVQDQLAYLKTIDLGFEKDNIMVISNVYNLEMTKEALKKELDQHTAVKSSAFASRLPAGSSWWLQTYDTPGLDEAISVQAFYGDENYLETLEIELLEGQNFAGLDSDTTKVIINEAAAKALKLADPLGATLDAGELYTVIGVMNDFNFESLTRTIAPVVLHYDFRDRYALAYKLKPEQSADFISFAKKVYEEISPDEPINYRFLDDRFNALLTKEDKLADGILSFAGIAIIISCLGLFGLSAYAAESRSKELGVRKVLGASVKQLVFMLTKSFTAPVVIAIALASPIAYLIMQEWKSLFVYQADFTGSLFIGAGLLAILLTWLTVGYFALSAASQSPTKTLRDE